VCRHAETEVTQVLSAPLPAIMGVGNEDIRHLKSIENTWLNAFGPRLRLRPLLSVCARFSFSGLCLALPIQNHGSSTSLQFD